MPQKTPHQNAEFFANRPMARTRFATTFRYGTLSILAMCQYLFDSLEDFLAAFNPHAAFLQGDMVNYTDIQPIIQISAVEIMR